MPSKKLEEFLNQNNKKKIEDKIDWEVEKTKWLESVNCLFYDVEAWLKPFKDKGQINLERKSITIDEEFIGKYNIDALYINLAGSIVTLEPVGRNIIGAKGRVDLSGRNGSIKLLYVNENSTRPRIIVTIGTERNSKIVDSKKEEPAKLVWKIATNPPNVEYITLNEDSFSEALLEVVK